MEPPVSDSGIATFDRSEEVLPELSSLVAAFTWLALAASATATAAPARPTASRRFTFLASLAEVMSFFSLSRGASRWAWSEVQRREGHHPGRAGIKYRHGAWRLASGRRR